MVKKIKICHIASVDITVKFLLMPQLQFLQSQGYDVSVVCSPGKWKKDIEREGVKVKNIIITRRITPVRDLVSLFQMFFYFKKEKFDIVHAHTPKPGLLGQLAAKMAGVPVVVNTIHGLYFRDDSPKFKNNFFLFCEKIAAKCSDLIFSQNQEDIKSLVGKKIVRQEIIRYLGNGVDVRRFNPQRFSKEFVKNKKAELGISPDFKVVGIVGRLVEEKGYFDLFCAFKKVLEKCPKTLLLAIGPEDKEKKDSFSSDIVKKYGIEKNVIFLGERSDIDELYPLMDIFVLASHREGFPRTVIEAMAMQRPIIATNIRGCREAIENGKNGILIPVKNPEILAEKIIFLLENPEIAQILVKSARQKAEKKFDENIIFKKIDKAYHELIGRKISPKSSLKICHVTTVDTTARFIILDFLKFLKSQGNQVHIVCSEGKWKHFLERQGFSVYCVKMLRKISPFADLKPFLKLFFYFKREKFDIVHTHTPKAGVLGRIAAKLAGVPVVIHTSHGFYIGVKIDQRSKNIILFAEKIASYFCDLVTSQNKEDVEFAIREKIVNPSKIKFFTFGIDINRFNSSKFSREFILNRKKELGLEGKKIIGMVGRFVEEKGYLDLFSVFKTVKEKIPDASLLLVAPNDQEKPDALDKSILKDFGIEKEAVILGYENEISNIEEIYPLMDIFVLPSYREGFPYSVMEASACKVPVIATDIRGCREAVENNKTGILIPVKNPDKLAEAIIHLLSDKEMAEQMGQNGRKKAEREFDERIVFDRIKEEYEKLVFEKNI